MKSLITIKTDKTLSPAEERYLRRFVLGNLIAKYIILTSQAAGFVFIIYLVLEWLIPGLTNSLSFRDFDYLAAAGNILALLLFLILILGSGLLVLGWHPLRAGYSIMTLHAVVTRKGRSLQYGPLIAPPPWRKYLPEQSPIPLKVAEFNGFSDLGRRAPILLGVPQLGLDMDQHAKLGLLKYRNTLFPGVAAVVSIFGMLAAWIGEVDRMGFFAGIEISLAAWVMNDTVHRAFAAFSVVGVWSVFTLLFVIPRNLIIRCRINKEIAGRSKKKSTWYK